MKMSRGINVLTMTFLAACPIGCTLEDQGQDPLDEGLREAELISAGLIRADSCEDVAATLKVQLIRDMETRLQANLEDALLAAAYPCEPSYGEEEEEEEEEEAIVTLI